MKNVSLILIHLLLVIAKLLDPGGIKGIIAENLLLKQQLLIVCQLRRPAPNLSPVGPKNRSLLILLHISG